MADVAEVDRMIALHNSGINLLSFYYIVGARTVSSDKFLKVQNMMQRGKNSFISSKWNFLLAKKVEEKELECMAEGLYPQWGCSVTDLRA